MKDQQLQNSLAYVMLWGVLLAAVVMGAGVVWFLAAHPSLRAGDHLFTGEPQYFENPISMTPRALHLDEIGHRRSLIMIGVVLLMINPLIRVAFAAFGFAVQKDRLYTLVSLIVLAVLIISFFW